LELLQVLDAKRHNPDCQRAPVSRKILVPADSPLALSS
jgi:hypothetical protein